MEKNIGLEKAPEKKGFDFELKRFDNSPSKYKKFLRTVADYYKNEKPTKDDKKVFCKRVLSSFFTADQLKGYSAKQKKAIDELIKERVTKAGGFLKVIKEKAQAENGEKLTDSKFDGAFRDFSDSVEPDAGLIRLEEINSFGYFGFDE